MCYVVLMSPKIGKNDESRERSRAALLQAGVDLLVENALRNPFAALRLRTICEKAGYSTGAFYSHWDRLDEYFQALAEHLAADAGEFDADFADLKKVAEDSAEASALAAVARVADCDFQLLLDSPIQNAMELLSVTWGRTRFRPQMARGYKQIDHQTGQAYAAIFAKRGREPRPPLDWDAIGAILQGLIEGLGLRYKVDPAAVPRSSDGELGMYATAVAALLSVLTRQAGDDASLDGAIQALLG